MKITGIHRMRLVRQAIVVMLAGLMIVGGVTMAVIGFFHLIPFIEFILQVAAGIAAFVLGVSALSYLAQGKV